MNVLQPPVVVLMTDFGITDTFIGQMKGVILSICPTAQIIDLTHAVLPQNVVQGAFLLSKSLPFLPDGAIVIAVVDPGVGTSRRAIALQTSRHTFLAPDNGLLTSILASGDAEQCAAVTNERYMLQQCSSTFHGRDIFSPVAAHLAAGVPLQSVGDIIALEECIRLPFWGGNSPDNGTTWEGEILYSDHFGNLITSIEAENFDRSKAWHVIAGTLAPLPLARTYGDVAEGEAVAYIGSSGTIELAIRNGNAAQTFGLKSGEKVRMESEERKMESAATRQDVANLLKHNVALQKKGKLKEARAGYEYILQQEPNNIDALHLLALVAYQAKEYSEALTLLNKAIAINPNFAQAHLHRGVVFKEMQQYNNALESYNKAIELNANDAAAYYNRANTLKAIKRFEEALISYNKAITLQPNYPEAYSNRGIALKELLRFEEALASYNKALELQPNYPEAYTNRGGVLKELFLFQEALASFDKAIALKPDFTEAHWNKALVHLLLGEFTEGWKCYEWRWKKTNFPEAKRKFSKPLWNGEESLAGRTILLHSEQGLGDTIQFCRYAQLVAEHGATVIFGVPELLVELFKSLQGVAHLSTTNASLPKYDYHSPLLSLPLAFNTTLATIPYTAKYLSSDPQKVAEWKARLPETTQPRIGLVWNGNSAHPNDNNRSIELSLLLQYLPTGLSYISLQKEIRESDKAALESAPHLVHFGDELSDFSDTAALCELMDIIICVDTSVAHLAAALGKPTWILLPFVPDWRWLLDRNDSPWYASATLYRQTHRNDWGNVLQKVQSNLRTRFKDYLKSDQQTTAIALLSDKSTIKQLQENAVALHKNGKLEEAKICYQEIIEKQPNNADAIHLLGVIAYQQDDCQKALPLLNNALTLKKNFPAAYFNRGLVYKKLERSTEALNDFNQAIEHNPKYAEAYLKRGNVLKELKEFDAALQSYNKAIELNPEYAGAYLDKSIQLLLTGDFLEGWKLYEWRWKAAKISMPEHTLAHPLWLGEESLAGKTIVLHSEQGLGDIIQFCRYAELVAERGATVLFEVPSVLFSLLQQLSAVTTLIKKGQAMPPYDFHCPLLSLPLACHTTLDTIPSGLPYLKSDTKKVAEWKKRLSNIVHPRVGLVWSGNSAHKKDHHRSIELSLLLNSLPEGINYISLQKEVRESDKAALESAEHIAHFGDELRDFSDTAALCELMDIIVCVDTSVAHLAAALGKPTWILLPFVPDWRWLLDRNDTPWYASATLYRQTQCNDWQSVLEQVHADLLECFTIKQHSKTSNNKSNATNLLRKATQLHTSGKLDDAKVCYQKILQEQPNNSDALHLLGVVAFQQKEHQMALSLLDKAIILKPNFSSAYFNRGLVYKALLQHDAALHNFTLAIQQQPDYAEAYLKKGNVLKTVKKFNESLECYNKALELKPNYTEAYLDKGNVLFELKKFDTALEYYEKVIQIKPDYAEAYSNRGVLLRELGKFDTALVSLNKAVAIKPSYAEAYSNRGVVLKECMEFEAAVTSFDKAIALKADYADAYWNKSLVLLALGNFIDGWQLHEWRWKKADFTSPKRNFTQPLWLGKESLAGKTIVLHSEQGLGDTIQFCRYAQRVAERDAQVFIEAPRSLTTLLQSLHGISGIITKGETLPPFDYHCPLLSLPLAFKTTLDTIPSTLQYLSSDKKIVSKWKKRLGKTTKLRIGLVWSGNSIHKNDRNRSIALSLLLQHLPADFSYVSLHKDVRESDKSALENAHHLLHFGDVLDDFSDTAALCELMDIVISVDTSVAHLAAALGKPTWILLPYVPDWRWLLDRDDTPWYPSAKLYRQTQRDDWESVLQRVQVDLQQHLMK